MDEIENDYSGLQLQVATQNNKKKRGKNLQKQGIVGAIMSQNAAPTNPNNNYSYNYNQNRPCYEYSQYNKDTYHCDKGNWRFNPNARPRQVVVQQDQIDLVPQVKPLPAMVPPVRIGLSSKHSKKEIDD